MEEEERYVFSYQDVVECLIKKQGIHEGLWGISIGFGFGAVNANTETDSQRYSPSAFVLVNEIGIRRFETPSNLTVDASLVNPKPKKPKRTKQK